jgi:hypothetical protein
MDVPLIKNKINRYFYQKFTNARVPFLILDGRPAPSLPVSVNEVHVLVSCVPFEVISP